MPDVNFELKSELLCSWKGIVKTVEHLRTFHVIYNSRLTQIQECNHPHWQKPLQIAQIKGQADNY